jgi:hypothetical protein
MNDEGLEQNLRKLPQPELPAGWRTEIIAQALREARESATSTRQVWPPFLMFLRKIVARNPLSAGALTALWLLIFVFKVSTPVDPSEKELLAHFDPNRPVYLVSLREEIQLAEFLQDQPDQWKNPQIP